MSLPVATIPISRVRRWFVSTTALFCLAAPIAQSQVVRVPEHPQVGSSNPTTAEPKIERPHTTPCTVQLFEDLEFADFNPKPYTYTPPAACPGPWAKVVFTADFTVTAGRQYDRTASFYLGHANIYYGTTAEPRATLSPSWHVERDVTDLSAIFKTAQTGQADLGNFVGVSGGVTYDGIIYANAALQFYPVSTHDAAAKVPDIVVPVEGSGGDAGTLNTTSDQITQTLNLPTNVEKVYLDVIAQSQSNDEFWYFCVPNDQTANLESCGNTAFRETEITIDGQPAGVAPIYPWIYTGGVDPYLWEPIPGVQTLNFKPYRVDLTPFAGVLGDGNSHTLAVSVYNANSYFLATANLLVYTDPGSTVVKGKLLSSTLSAAPSPIVTENISADSSGTGFTGNVLVTSRRNFEIRGFVNTSHGHVETTVRQSVDFSSNQTFDVGPTKDIQKAHQLTTVVSTTVTRDGGLEKVAESQIRYPFYFGYAFVVNPDGSFYQSSTADQKNSDDEELEANGRKLYGSRTNEEVHATDTLNWDANGNFLGPTGARAWQDYVWKNSFGDCYSRNLTAADQKVTSVDGAACK